MKFVQIIEFRTKDIDAVRKLDADWQVKTEGKRTVERSYVCQDRDDPNRYFVVAVFPSWEAAQKNNELPETQEIAEQQMKLSEGPPTFYNLDVMDEQIG
jgi:quinol monooxygenase YgiN